MPRLSLVILKAQPADVDKVVALVDKLALWMVTSGIKQCPYPSPQSYRDLVARESARGNVYLIRVSSKGEPVGAFPLGWEPDELRAGKTDTAAYLYGLAVSRSVKGQGVGTAVISWLEAHLVDQGVALLRLNCVATSAVLRRYYERLGCALMGEALTPWYPLPSTKSAWSYNPVALTSSL